jgi:cysteinyl-tRNA synthetase
VRLYNTLTRREEEFVPLRDNTVRMYTCGLTVYARGHIGNFRTFVCLDVLRRALKYLEGYRVRQVMNFTDVDDRTIAESNKAGVPLREYTDRYITAFHEDASMLGLEPVEETPRATDEENLRAMSELIRDLDARGHTYRSDGSVYFRISTLPDYGKLARLDHEGMQAGARVDSDRYEKADARDFVLWKAPKPGEPSWDFGVGQGRPGWHIECSAMALRLLGEPPIDIHAGGVDLIFPHHENEIAQSEGGTGKPFARVWVHTEHLVIEDGEKMSKSLGNVFTVQDVVRQGYRASALRYLLLSVHYRKQLRFTWPSLAQAEEALKRLTDFVARLDTVTGAASHPAVAAKIEDARAAFAQALREDLNTAGALGAVFEFVRAMNAAIDTGQVGAADARRVHDTIGDFDRVLGVLSLRQEEDATPPLPVAEIERLMTERQAARRARDFAAADRIRQQLEECGILLEDTAAGTRWKRK